MKKILAAIIMTTAFGYLLLKNMVSSKPIYQIYESRNISARLIKAEIPDISVWQINAQKLQAKIVRKYPWIKSVKIRKKLLNKLTIEIVEYDFIGFHNGAFITTEGKRIAVDRNIASDAPIVYGNFNIEDFLNLIKQLNELGIKPKIIKHRKYYGWNILVDNFYIALKKDQVKHSIATFREHSFQEKIQKKKKSNTSIYFIDTRAMPVVSYKAISWGEIQQGFGSPQLSQQFSHGNGQKI